MAPLVITTQLSSVTVEVRRAVVLNAGISGPASYQWQTNGTSGFVNLPGATFPALTNIYNSPGTFSYRVIATGLLSSVTNGVAVVNVIPDWSGPLILSATVLEEAARTNRVELVFSERLHLFTVDSSVDRILDFGTNSIVPNSVMAVRWPYNTNVISTNALWEYHNQSLADPTVYQTVWNVVEYDTATNGWWQDGEPARIAVSSCHDPSRRGAQVLSGEPGFNA